MNDPTPGTVRVAAGRHRGRKLVVPGLAGVRPTPARVREALFDILGHREWAAMGGPLPGGARVLDLFAGSGALGLEALSRGAREVLFVESERGARDAINRNIGVLGEQGRAFVLPRDALRPGARPGQAAFALVLADPPYGSGLVAPALSALVREKWLAKHAVAVAELDAREDFAPPEGFAPADERRYGDTRLVFLEATLCRGGARLTPAAARGLRRGWARPAPCAGSRRSRPGLRAACPRTPTTA